MQNSWQLSRLGNSCIHVVFVFFQCRVVFFFLCHVVFWSFIKLTQFSFNSYNFKIFVSLCRVHFFICVMLCFNYFFVSCQICICVVSKIVRFTIKEGFFFPLFEFALIILLSKVILRVLFFGLPLILMSLGVWSSYTI